MTYLFVQIFPGLRLSSAPHQDFHLLSEIKSLTITLWCLKKIINIQKYMLYFLGVAEICKL